MYNIITQSHYAIIALEKFYSKPTQLRRIIHGGFPTSWLETWKSSNYLSYIIYYILQDVLS